MLANSIGSWFKRWGLAIIAGLCAVLYFVLKLIPTRPGASKVVDDAKAAAKQLSDDKTKALTDHAATMDANRVQLAQIKTISDDEARLQALADFANGKK